MSKNLLSNKSEILEPLHLVAEELLERDKSGKSNIEYTDYDVVAVAVVFVHILANRKAHYYYRQAASSTEPSDLDKVKQEMTDYGERINKLVLEMTGVELGKKENENE